MRDVGSRLGAKKNGEVMKNGESFFFLNAIRNWEFMVFFFDLRYEWNIENVTNAYICRELNIYIYIPYASSTIWYSLEHTGNARTYRVSLEHTRITPRTYQEATNDYTGSGLRVIPGYTRILAQGIVIGYAKTRLDCPQMPSRKN